jgi:hypothetical protein
MSVRQIPHIRNIGFLDRGFHLLINSGTQLCYFGSNYFITMKIKGTRQRMWLRLYATRRKIVGSNLGEVIEFF